MKYTINFNNNSVEQDLTEFSLEDRAELFEGDAPESSIMEFEDIYETIASILPNEFFEHNAFKKLEAIFLLMRLPEDAWLPISVYQHRNNITRQGVYYRQKLGTVEMLTEKGRTFVRDVE